MKLDLELPSLSCLVTSCSLHFVFTIININYVLQMSAEMIKEHVDNLSELLLHTWTVHHQSIFTAICQLSRPSNNLWISSVGQHSTVHFVGSRSVHYRKDGELGKSCRACQLTAACCLRQNTNDKQHGGPHEKNLLHTGCKAALGALTRI